ncbi:MAG: hypothetical protein Q8Q03_02845, partial [bacterium]|nr:hypothetical protein [bacterium]
MSLEPEEKYRVGDILRYKIPDNKELLYLKDRKLIKEVSSSLIEKLLLCSSFRSLDSHAELIHQKTGPSGKTLQEIKNQLKELADEGFLIKQSQVFESLTSMNAPDSGADPILHIGVPTRDAVLSLERTLISFIESSQKYGRNIEYLIADSSQNDAIRHENQQILRLLKGKYDIRISYAGTDEKNLYIKELLKENNFPEEILRFALFDTEEVGHDSGVNRNAILLHSVGDLVLMTDNDTVCQVTNAPNFRKTLTLGSGEDPTEFSFFQDREEMMRKISFKTEDVLAIHEEFIGKSLENCINHYGNIHGIDIDRMSPAFLRKLNGKGGKILCTMMGIAGDVASGSPFGYLLLKGISRERLLRSEEAYQKIILNRHVLRKTNFPAITDGSFLMTTTVALDHREVLPPFLPVFRNSDSVFGTTLRKCFENGYIS